MSNSLFMQHCAMTELSVDIINEWFRDKTVNTLLPRYLKRLDDTQLFQDISIDTKRLAVSIYLKNTQGAGVTGVVTQSILSEMGSASGLDEMTVKKMIPTS